MENDPSEQDGGERLRDDIHHVDIILSVMITCAGVQEDCDLFFMLRPGSTHPAIRLDWGGRTTEFDTGSASERVREHQILDNLLSSHWYERNERNGECVE